MSGWKAGAINWCVARRTRGSGSRGGRAWILNLLRARPPGCASGATCGVKERTSVPTVWPSAGTEAWSQQQVSGRGGQACGA